MAAMAKLLEQHHQVLSAEFKTKKKKPSQHSRRRLTAFRHNHRHKIALLESSANDLDERVRALEATCATLAESSAKLQNKVVDLEAHSCCNNIQIVGITRRAVSLSFLCASSRRHFGRHLTLSAGD